MINAVSRFPDSSMVEHTAVNRGVVGSSPTRGAKIIAKQMLGYFCVIYYLLKYSIDFFISAGIS